MSLTRVRLKAPSGRTWPRIPDSWDSISRCPGARGLEEILKTVDATLFELTYDPQGRQIAPKGIDIILALFGNDVYGEWGYLGYTWHNKQKWVKGYEDLRRQAATWAPKQKKKVEETIEKLKILVAMLHVKSVTLLSGKSMGTSLMLPSCILGPLRTQRTSAYGSRCSQSSTDPNQPWPAHLNAC